MAISPNLTKFISSGVYRLTIDRSQVVSSTSQTIRLVIGFSKKGPFNTPVFVQDSVFFRAVFGDIDTLLERKGSFFHRTALTCLERGPILALNLLSLDDDVDKSDFRSISTAAWQANSPRVNAPVSGYFNKDKFWFADSRALQDAAANTDNQSALEDRLLNIANVGRKTISVILKKSDLLGFDAIAKDYFGAGKIPEFMRETDFVSDYLVDVIVVEGDFSDYIALSLDPVFGPYFDATGLKKTYVDPYGFERDGLESFLGLDQVNVLGAYSGALVPDFVTKTGENIYIEDVVKNETMRTGLLLSVDRDTYDDAPETISGDLVDLVGHGLESEQPAVLDFLSYYGVISSTAGYAGATGITSFIVGATVGLAGAQALLAASTTLQSSAGWTVGYYDTMTIYGPSATLPSGYVSAFANPAAFAAWRAGVAADQTFVKAGASAIGGASGNYSYVAASTYSSTADTLTLRISTLAGAGVTGPTAVSGGFYHILATGATPNGGTAAVPVIPSLNFVFSQGGDVYAGQYSTLYQANLNGTLTDGDAVITAAGGTAFDYAQFARYSTNDYSGATFSTPAAFGAETPLLNAFVGYARVDAFTNADFTGATAIAPQTEYVFRTLTEDVNETLEVWGGTAYPVPTNTLYFDNGSTGPYGLDGFTGRIRKGDLLLVNFGGTGGATSTDPVTGKTRLTRIVSVQETVDPLSPLYKKVRVVTVDPIFTTTTGGVIEVERYRNVTNFVDHYRFHVLRGYSLRPEQMPDGTADREADILDVMYDTGIAQALADREVTTFRYIVDSFQGTIEPATKIRLSRLARDRQNAFVIANMPSTKQFRDSTNPLFKFSTTSGFDPRYIKDGGNLDLNPTNVFSLPDINDGASFIAFYGPNLLIRENGKTISVPPSAHVSNLYVEKYNLALPYSIVAGPRRGVVSGPGLVGVENNFDRTDLDYIEPFGYNAILNKRGFGLVINANNTAQQRILSSLSQIHVQELVIYIQDGIEQILKNYRWEFNVPQVRLEIKTLADGFMQQIAADGGVYEFRNIIDSTNNTDEVIQADTAILDTYIEPVRGMGKIIHRTILLKKGIIKTGNFI